MLENESDMCRSLPALIMMLTAVMILMLLHLYEANSQGEETCTTENMRKAVVEEQLAALGCDNSTCVT